MFGISVVCCWIYATKDAFRPTRHDQQEDSGIIPEQYANQLGKNSRLWQLKSLARCLRAARLLNADVLGTAYVDGRLSRPGQSSNWKPADARVAERLASVKILISNAMV
jgi:hypothetical protein